MPWVRKTESTIDQDLARQRWSPWLAIWVFFIFFIGGPFLALNNTGGDGGWMFDLWGISGLVEVLIATTLLAMGVSIACYVYQILSGFPIVNIDRKLDICPECRILMPIGKRACQCDCEVEPSEEWTFNDDEKKKKTWRNIRC